MTLLRQSCFKTGLVSFILCFAWGLRGETDLSVHDTIQLEEFVTYSEIQKFQAGAKIEKIPHHQFQMAQDGNLEQLLSRTTPIRLKANAGGLSTIRVRGTAPDHTSINFGGININSLTLGHSNISNVPMYLFDNVGIQYGSSSAVNGSGSIGGAIHLGLNNYWTKGVKGEVRVSHGAFGEQFYGTKLRIGNGKLESVTRAYYYYKENNFPFSNEKYDFPTKSYIHFTDTQHNAAIENYGFIQELNYKFEDDEMLLARVWYENDWHNVQQKTDENRDHPETSETYLDEHLRIWTEYINKQHAIKYQIGGGYAYDLGVHNNTPDIISIKRYILKPSIEHDLNKNISYKAGVNATRIIPNVYSYQNIDYENRVDLFASYNHQLFSSLLMTANLRQGFVTNYNVPFTPALGFKYIVLSKEEYLLDFYGNISKSYRVPTFNDRYWPESGNPNLLPEDGVNYELASKLSYCEQKTSGNLKVNLFYMNIDDWILWKPGTVNWEPQNVQEVISKGVELMLDFNIDLGRLNYLSGINYTLTSTERIKGEDTTALHRQIEYVPQYAANFYNTISYKEFNFSIDGSYTGWQYIEENSTRTLPAYFLLNLSSSYKYKITSDHSLKISGMVNNLLNKDYQASFQYAMPGINYRISITYNFK